ncbi:c-type cytochrome biogenesis protein CcsB, partial [Agromyces binzhouensis]
MTLDEISIIAVYSAMAVYAIAFIAYAIDLARRSAASAQATDAAAARIAEDTVAGGASEREP